MVSEAACESLKVGNRHPVTELAIIQCVAGLCQAILSIYNFQRYSFVCLITRDVQPEVLCSEVGRAAECAEESNGPQIT